MTRYRDLPERGNGRGIALMCPNPDCSQHGVPWSPDRGDYWYMPDDRRVDCGTCTEALDLVQHIDYWEPVR